MRDDRPEISGNRIAIPSDPELIRIVDEFVESRLQESGLDQTLIADIAICATEIVNNGIEHGNQLNRDKRVLLELELSDSEVKVTVTDEGEFFDPDAIANPIAEENLLREVGRGIFIVKQLMDEVTIGRADNGGTVVSFTKKTA
jgi:serine/threonine-protein kinase RsbW